jgi:FkbM family methyltransferase
MANARNPKLIFDIGTSEGNDTAFYLAKGFDVVAVEADPVAFEAFRARFEHDIGAGRLTSLNLAVHGTSGCVLEFWRNDCAQGLSSLHKSSKPRFAGQQTSFKVNSIDYDGLVSLYGIPHYCKIDVEGGEVDFLRSIGSLETAPRYMSAEAHSLAPIEELHRIGYRKFKLVDQKIVGIFSLPHPPLEGVFLEKPNFKHASGPFGRELPGDWLEFDRIKSIFETIQELKTYRTVLWSWYDCHAWNGEDD